MRSLFFINSFAGGGAERVTANLIEHLAQETAVDVITAYRDNREAYSLPANVTVLPLGVDSNASPLRRIASLARARERVNNFIRQREAEEAYALITAHLTASHFLAASTVVSNRCLYVHHALVDAAAGHNLTGARRTLQRALYRGKRQVAVSEGVRQQIVREFNIPDHDVATINNPVPYESIRKQAATPKKLSRPYLLSVGRLEEVKRPMFLLDLYAKSGLVEDYDLVLLGQGPMEQEIRASIRACGLGDRVHLLGFQKNPFAWMAGSQAMLMVSEQEALPTVLIEGILAGARVISGDCDFGPREILTGEYAPFLVPRDDPNAYVSAIELAKVHFPSLQKGFVERFSPEVVAKQYLEFYRTKA